jgi:hypothetical protein
MLGELSSISHWRPTGSLLFSWDRRRTMSMYQARAAAGALLIVFLATGLCGAAESDALKASDADAALKDIGGRQEELELPVRVVSPDGQPVAKAKVTPWALRSSLGHGPWRDHPKERAGFGPKASADLGIRKCSMTSNRR